MYRWTKASIHRAPKKCLPRENNNVRSGVFINIDRQRTIISRDKVFAKAIFMALRNSMAINQSSNEQTNPLINQIDQPAITYQPSAKDASMTNQSKYKTATAVL